MSNNKQKTSWWIVVSFILVPLIVSVVSTIHVISFFQLSNYYALSLTLALAFEIGALSSLAGLVAMDKLNKGTIWTIFLLLTIFQMMGNTYYAYDTISLKMIKDSNLITNFTELFGFDIYDNNDVIFVKRIISMLSGAILPVISLSFLHLLVTYITKTSLKEKAEIPQDMKEEIEEEIENDLRNGSSSIALPSSDNNVPGAPNEKPNFEQVIAEKKSKLIEDRKKLIPLLDVLFENGSIGKGNVLASYNEFIQQVDKNLYTDDDVKRFLTLCNYLDITIVSNQERTSLVSYEEAKEKLENYLSFEAE